MSANLGRTVSLLSIALVAGLLTSQEKAKTVDDLRKENAALRAQVKTLQAQLGAKRNVATSKQPVSQRRVVADKKLKNVERVPNPAKRLDLMRRATIQTLLGRIVHAEMRAHGRHPTGDYWKSVVKLRRATQNLNPMIDPVKARNIVNDIERALLDVRRELWKIERAEKKKTKEKNGNHPDSSVVLPSRSG